VDCAPRNPRVALVHDYLNQRGGAERVFAQMAAAYPFAPVYTALYDRRATGDLIAPGRVRASLLDRLPGSGAYFRALAPLYPLVFERMDLRAYDVVVSSTSAWAKGVHVRPDALHVCYIHTVSRFLFAYEQYVGGFGLGTLAKPLVERLCAWDLRAAARPTAYIANSRNVAARVQRYYGRDAYVLPGPVELDRLRVGTERDRYMIVVSRLLPYKRVDLAIDACAKAGVPLLVVGTGPAERALRQRAAGTTTTLLGFLPDDEVNALVGRARALIFPGEEDYGLVPIEAAAAGTPTIAYAAGGALETVIAGTTGAFFDVQDASALAGTIAAFDPAAYDRAALRAHAQTYAPERFRERLREIVSAVAARPRAAI
jgi:glycosyltransferase involved in cell wall biosynthesis